MALPTGCEYSRHPRGILQVLTWDNKKRWAGALTFCTGSAHTGALGMLAESQNPTKYAVTLRAHEGTLSTTVSTSTVRSPACAGGGGAAVAVVPVPLSAAIGESAARKGNARKNAAHVAAAHTHGVLTRGSRGTHMGLRVQ